MIPRSVRNRLHTLNAQRLWKAHAPKRSLPQIIKTIKSKKEDDPITMVVTHMNGYARKHTGTFLEYKPFKHPPEYVYFTNNNGQRTSVPVVSILKVK